MAEDAKSSGFKAIGISVVSAIVIALAVGSQQPYWLKYFKNNVVEEKTEVSPAPSLARTQEPTPVASEKFLPGRWHAEVSLGASIAHANTIDFLPNGRFDGDRSGTDTQGALIHVAGGWKFEKVSDTVFLVSFKLDRGISITPTKWTVKYKIIDRDHIENLNGGFIVDQMN